MCAPSYSIMPRNVIDDTYLGKLGNLVEEHPALVYNTPLDEYIMKTSAFETFGTV